MRSRAGDEAADRARALQQKISRQEEGFPKQSPAEPQASVSEKN
jgi:hypothetical protein